jgi:hypothetical protein
MEKRRNESGIYYISALPPDQYTLTVEVPGFKRLVTNPITLEVNQTAAWTWPLRSERWLRRSK